MDLQSSPDSQIPQSQTPEKPKNKFWKFVLGFLAFLIGVFLLYVIAFWAVKVWEQKRGENEVRQLAENMDKFFKDRYERAMADAYGGKTPQETLQMYIDAVQKGDYELASKYFIEDYRESELNSLKISKKEVIDDVINLLKQTIKNKGSYSWDKKYFGINEPLSADFELYPNSIWKLISI